MTKKKSINLKEYFGELILGRGEDYYNRNAIAHYHEENGVIEAEVIGTYDYDVSIALTEDGDVLDMSCDCPYALSGTPCKHMAAVLISYNDSIKDNGFVEDKVNESEDSSTNKVEEVIKSLKPNEIHQMLTAYLLNHPNLLDNLYSKRHPNLVLEAYDSQLKNILDNIDAYFEEVKEIDLYEHYESWDIYDYDEIIEVDVGPYLKSFKLYCTKLIFCGFYQEAYALIAQVLIHFDKKIFFYDGEVDIEFTETKMENTCATLLENLFENLGLEERRTQFEYMIKLLKENMPKFGMTLLKLSMSYFDNLEFNQIMVDTIAPHIKGELIEGLEINSWSKWYFKILMSTSKDHDKIKNEISQYLEYGVFEEDYVEYCLKHGLYDDAINTMKNSIQRHKSSYKLYLLEEALLEIYRTANREDDLHDMLWSMITKSRKPQLEHYNELKAMYTNEIWVKKRNMLFSQCSQDADLCDLYDLENMEEALLEAVLKTKGVDRLMKFDIKLSENYSKEILTKYASELEFMVQEAKKRSVYQHWAYILKHIQKCKGGHEFVSTLLDDWRVRFAKRSAMRQEFNKLGLRM